MFDNSRGKQTNVVRQDALAPKEQEQAAERRWFQDALEDDDVNEALASLRAQDKTKSTENQDSLPRQASGRSICNS
jgi:hypothetical protein